MHHGIALFSGRLFMGRRMGIGCTAFVKHKLDVAYSADYIVDIR